MEKLFAPFPRFLHPLSGNRKGQEKLSRIIDSVSYPMEKGMAKAFILLLLGMLAFAFILPPALPAREEPAPAALQGGPEWLRGARVAGLEVGEALSDSALDERMGRLARQRVSVVRGECALESCVDDAVFSRRLALVGRVAAAAHRKGMRLVWYYPALSVVTPRVGERSGAMRALHPDWLQRNFDRRKGAGAGDRERLNYVAAEGRETAWMCPNSPYREWFFARVERLAATGIDGIWFGAAVFHSSAGVWPCSDPYCERTFFDETGCRFPSRLSMYDIGFKEWVLWRHRTLAAFLSEGAARARAVRGDLACVVESAACDHPANTLEGLDAAWLDEDLSVAWNLAPISDTTGMRQATERDWLSMMVTYKYCGGVSPGVPMAFCSAERDDDGQLVMAAALAAQCSPVETKVGSRTGSVGSDARTRLYGWVEKNRRDLFETKSDAPVALLYSPETRDFVDGIRQGGLYLTAGAPSPALAWQVPRPEASIVECDYLTEYKGWGMLLIRNHIPFDVIDARSIGEGELTRYRAVILPNLVCLSTESRDRVLDYVMEGGNMLITGEKAGGYSELGVKLKAGLWADLGKMGRLAQMETLFGSGRVVIRKDLPGKLFIYDRGERIAGPCLSYLRECGVRSLVSGRPPVYVQQYRRDGEVVLHLVNYGWVGGDERPVKSLSVEMRLPWDEGMPVRRIIASSPGSADVEIPFVLGEGGLEFSVGVSVNTLVRVEAE